LKTSKTAELALDAGALLGEGPVWDERQGRLFWVDIEAGRVHSYDPASGSDEAVELGRRVGCLALRASGGLLAGTEEGIGALELSSGAFRLLADPEADRPRNRFNDGKCDAAGRFWAGTMSMDREEGAGSLYCLEPDLSIRRVLSGVTTSNGLAWSADNKTLYYIDTRTRAVAAFDYDLARGTVANRRELIRVPPELGKPDGMCIDSGGLLWIAMFGGGKITCWNTADGSLAAVYDVPAPRVTSCCFGGRDLDTLYITSARFGLSADELAAFPLSGGLFRLDAGVRGAAVPCFAG
jgi:sugar lactone lactonase YvrE